MSEDERRVLPKATKGRTRAEKRSRSRVFLEEDMPIIKDSIMDIVIPEVLNTTFDVGKRFLEMIIFKDYDDDRSYRRDSRSGGRTRKQDYSGYYRGRSYNRSDSNRQRAGGSPRSRYEVDEVIFENRADADQVLNILSEEMEDYGRVTVGTYYSACDISPRGGDFNYGWYDIRNARIQRRGRDWAIVMPKCVPMDD